MSKPECLFFIHFIYIYIYIYIYRKIFYTAICNTYNLTSVALNSVSDYCILYQLGIVDVFNDAKADLSRISPHNIHLHKLIHKAEIVINEEGTTASSTTGQSR
jgi:hypothetical protein